MKRLKYQTLNEELMAKFTHELMILSRVRHRNVVQFIGAVVEQPNLCVVMEFMTAGSLNDLLHKQGAKLTPTPPLPYISVYLLSRHISPYLPRRQAHSNPTSPHISLGVKLTLTPYLPTSP